MTLKSQVATIVAINRGVCNSPLDYIESAEVADQIIELVRKSLPAKMERYATDDYEEDLGKVSFNQCLSDIISILSK